MLKTLLSIFIFIVLLQPANALTFNSAKNKLKNLYTEFPSTFYCGCDIKWVSKSKLIPEHNSCGYTPRKQAKRAARIEWEHVVPAWEFGHQRQCWQNGGRKNCVKTDKVFKQMEGDVYNLVPSVGEVNGDRSNYGFGMIAGENRVYGQCDAEVDFKSKTFEPRPEIRGDIARTYFYFKDKYNLKISCKNMQLFNAWNNQDPITKEECNIYYAKKKLVNEANNILEKQCSTL